jgi:hypothetical protein
VAVVSRTAAAPSLTFIVPGLNEEANIAATVAEIGRVTDLLAGHEILLIDDGSTDRTGAIMDELAAARPDRVRAIHHERNLGLGAAYRRGVAEARCEHLMLIPGDNQFPAQSMRLVVERVGEADIVVQYTSNPEVRAPGRRLLSSAYTAILDALFGLDLKYFNGTVVHRTALVRSVRMTTGGFAYQAEILIRLLKRGATHVQVGVPITERQGGRSAALRARNVAAVFSTVARLIWEIHVLRQP